MPETTWLSSKPQLSDFTVTLNWVFFFLFPTQIQVRTDGFTTLSEVKHHHQIRVNSRHTQSGQSSDSARWLGFPELSKLYFYPVCKAECMNDAILS